MNRVALVRDPLFLEHENRLGEPEEVPDRLRALDAMLERHPLREWMDDLPARDASFEELCLVHDPEYVRRVERTAGTEFTELDESTSAGPRSHAAAVRSAGACLAAVEAVLSGSHPASFALVRPPGHHAERDHAMGFCIFANAAIAAAAALRRGVERVLIVDWDVHHGNGTMNAFRESDRVLCFSIHQFPEYPGSGAAEETGTGAGKGYSINVPFPPGQGDAEYLAAFRGILEPAARSFRPQLLLVSAGFDAHAGDPLAGMRLTGQGYGLLTGVLLEIAAACCPGRLAFLLEGGYGLGGLAAGASAVLTALVTGASPAYDPGAAGSEAREAIGRVRSVLTPFWPVT